MSRQLIPPFTALTARAQVQAAETAWNTRDPDSVARACSVESEWRNRDACFAGRKAIKAFLNRKWASEIHYRLGNELWSWTGNRISVRFECEWQDATSGQWYRTHGNGHRAFDEDGLMRRRDMSANDIRIEAGIHQPESEE